MSTDSSEVDAELTVIDKTSDVEVLEHQNNTHHRTIESFRHKLIQRCLPKRGLSLQEASPLICCLLGLTFTIVGSWDCAYFKGATISFTGNLYGIWTLQDDNGKCQLWDVLFFSYDLGGPLIAARCFSMAGQLLGLSLLTTLLQALEFHAVSWGIGLAFFLLFMVSVSTTSIFNVWIVFWALTYVIFILIVRALFIHPLPRTISKRGCHYIASLFVICGICSLLTLVVLKSEFCTCADITSQKLEGRTPGDPCQENCRLHSSGYVTVMSTIFWWAAAITTLKYGVQPERCCQRILEASQKDIYANYPRASITTRAIQLEENIHQRISRAANNLSPPLPFYNSFNRELSYSGAQTTDTNTATEESGQSASLPESTVEEEEDSRDRCQKFCCDYRIKPRTKRERWRFWSFRVMLGILIGLYIFYVTILIGARAENTAAAKAPDTSYNFITNVVCAFDPLDHTAPFKTFPTKEDAHLSGYAVAHCGACGYCSNMPDIHTYIETRKTIAKTAKSCSTHAVFGTFNELVQCLEDKIKFTHDCTICWAQNMKSTQKQCLYTCMTTLFTGFMSNNNVPGAGDKGWLNQCLFCDEKLSGPGFVACSGVARRRLGVVSEIERNPEEQCKNMDVDWVSVNWTTFSH